MGVYIKGMDMPTSCDNCWALDDYGDYPRCRITEEQRGYNFNVREKRMERCPLVPVPPHGRLIDADALEYTMLYKENWMHSTGVEALAVWKNDIESAPTIIPAEEVE